MRNAFVLMLPLFLLKASVLSNPLLSWVHFEKYLLRSSASEKLTVNWFSIEPTFGCIGGEELVGQWGDGVKWVCGLRNLQAPCIVYSIGGHDEFQFEDDVRRVTPCAVHKFDPLSSGADFVHTWAIGTADAEGAGGTVPPDPVIVPMKTLASTMRLLNHTSIDVLKLDIEGDEFALIEHLANQPTLLRADVVRQILVEVHFRTPSLVAGLFATLHRAGYAVFHKKINALYPFACDFALIPVPPSPQIFVARHLQHRNQKLSEYAARHIVRRASCSGNFLLFRCRHNDDCGGVGDRFAGLVTTFALAVLTNRTFLADVDFLDAVVQPSRQVDWRMNERLVRCLENATVIDLMNRPYRLELEELFPTLTPHIAVKSNRGRLHALLANKLHADSLGLEPRTAFGVLFDELFLPSAAVNKAIKKTETASKMVLATHVRMGDAQFTSHQIPTGAIDALFARFACMARVEEAAMSLWAGGFNNQTIFEASRWLVLTDSSSLNQAAMTHERVVALAARKAHINYKEYLKEQSFNETEYVENLVHTYVEWFLLSDASVILSELQSGFARTALFASLARRERNWASFAVIDPATCTPWGPQSLFTWIAEGAGI